MECIGEKNTALKEYIKSEGLRDYVLLSTCNRVELYSTEPLCYGGFELMAGDEAVRHLCRVSAGLDSMIVGECEILGQIKEAHIKAVSEGHCSPTLSSMFESAVKLGRGVRAKTRISEGKTSIASIAVDYAINQVSYPITRVVVIGSGSMGSKIACALKNKKVEQIFLANRRMERARALAEKVGGKAVDYCNLRELLGNTSVVFTATSAPHAIIKPDIIPSGRRILFIDLGVPPDVSESVSKMTDVEVVGLSTFKALAEENAIAKIGEVKKAEEYIEVNLKFFPPS